MDKSAANIHNAVKYSNCQTFLVISKIPPVVQDPASTLPHTLLVQPCFVQLEMKHTNPTLLDLRKDQSALCFDDLARPLTPESDHTPFCHSFSTTDVQSIACENAFERHTHLHTLPHSNHGQIELCVYSQSVSR